MKSAPVNEEEPRDLRKTLIETFHSHFDRSALQNKVRTRGMWSQPLLKHPLRAALCRILVFFALVDVGTNSRKCRFNLRQPRRMQPRLIIHPRQNNDAFCLSLSVPFGVLGRSSAQINEFPRFFFGSRMCASSICINRGNTTAL